MRKFPEQKLFKTFKGALNRSIKKWEFLSDCTLEEFEKYKDYISDLCSLCHYAKEKRSCDTCLACPMPGECEDLDEVFRICFYVRRGGGPLSDFHDAAKTVLNKLKTLKG